MYKKKAMYKKKLVKVPHATKKEPHFKVKEVGGEKNGKTRIVQLKKSVSIIVMYGRVIQYYTRSRVSIKLKMIPGM